MEKERIDLTKYLVNEDKPNGKERYWYAGEQLEALRFYLDEKIEIKGSYSEDDYQGECFAYFVVEDKHILWRDSFGSCSGCDGLDCANGYEYIKSTLQEGNTKQFDTKEELLRWLNETEDFLWEEIKEKEVKEELRL